MKRLRTKAVVFAGLMLALLLVVGSLGFFYFKNNGNLLSLDIHGTNNSSNSLTPADVYATATRGISTINDPLNSSVP